MLSSKFNRKIKIEKKGESTNKVGTPTFDFLYFKTKWANVDYRGGRTNEQTHYLQTTTDATFMIRYDKDVDYNCQIIYNDSIYQIDHIEIIGRNEGMAIKTVLYNE
ncbi:MAG: phage head closure protein [bacterium]